MAAAGHVDGRVLWANLFLLFWLSLVPFVIRWHDASGFAEGATATYGLVLGMASVAYELLTRAIIAAEGPGSTVAKAVQSSRKGLVSIALYIVAVALAYRPLRLRRHLRPGDPGLVGARPSNDPGILHPVMPASPLQFVARGDQACYTNGGSFSAIPAERAGAAGVSRIVLVEAPIASDAHGAETLLDWDHLQSFLAVARHGNLRLGAHATRHANDYGKTA